MPDLVTLASLAGHMGLLSLGHVAIPSIHGVPFIRDSEAFGYGVASDVQTSCSIA